MCTFNHSTIDTTSLSSGNKCISLPSSHYRSALQPSWTFQFWLTFFRQNNYFKINFLLPILGNNSAYSGLHNLLVFHISGSSKNNNEIQNIMSFNVKRLFNKNISIILKHKTQRILNRVGRLLDYHNYNCKTNIYESNIWFTTQIVIYLRDGTHIRLVKRHIYRVI